MRQKALSDWIKAEAGRAGSFRRLAEALGVSPTTVFALRDQEREKIGDALVKAIALRRKESVAATAAWLGVEPPADYDLPAQFKALQDRLELMERKVEVVYQRLRSQDGPDPSLTISSYLLEKGINLHVLADQELVRDRAEKAAPDCPAAFERFLLISLGIIGATRSDLPMLSATLKLLTGDPWTPEEVSRVLNQN